MLRFTGAIAFSFLLCLGAWADRVVTRDGRVLSGRVSIGLDGTVKVGLRGVVGSDLSRIILDNALAQPGLSGVTFKTYLGDWTSLPDVASLPIDKMGRLTSGRLEIAEPRQIFKLRQGQRITRWSAPQVQDRPFSVSATVTAVAGEGVILAQGGNIDGYALYLQGGILNFATRVDRVLTVAKDTKSFPLNRPVKISAQLRRDLALVLTVDGHQVASLPSPGLLPRHPFEGLSMGHDQRPSLVGNYPGENYFQGDIQTAQVRLMGMSRVFAGELHVATAGQYTFKYIAKDATRLEIDGRKVVDAANAARPTPRSGTVHLAAGSHEFRLTCSQRANAANAAGDTPGRLTLEWSGPGMPQLSKIPHVPSPVWQPPNMAIPAAGIMMLDGSFIAHPALSVDRAKVHHAQGSLPRFYASTIFLRPVTIAESRKIPARTTGMLWADGAFTRGKLHSLDAHSVTISSVLFGLRKLKREEEILAVVLKRPDPPARRLSVHLRDGSVHFARKISGEKGRIKLTQPPYRDRLFPRKQVAEFFFQRQSSLPQAAEARWDGLSDLGRHLLETKGRGIKAVYQN